MSLNTNDRISVSEAASNLFNRAELLQAYRPRNPPLPRQREPWSGAPPTCAQIRENLDELEDERSYRRDLGAQVELRILEILNAAGCLVYLTVPLMYLDEVLHEALDHLDRTGQHFVFVSPPMLAPPNLAFMYASCGWWPRVGWANFQPDLLEVRREDDGTVWVRVIEIKGRFGHDLDKSLSPSERFQVFTYNLFLSQLLHEAKRTGLFPHLDNVNISPTVTVWRYFGCLSPACPHPHCFLKNNLAANNLDQHFLDFAGCINVQVGGADLEEVENQLYDKIPSALELSRMRAERSECQALMEWQAIDDAIEEERIRIQHIREAKLEDDLHELAIWAAIDRAIEEEEYDASWW